MLASRHTPSLRARDAARGEAAARRIAGDARACPLDVTRADAIAAAFARVQRELGRLDVLINNAGSGVAYGPSKSALNAVTVAFAQELADTNIKVNAACPGHTATDLNGHSGPRTAAEAAREPVRLALLDDDGPTGTFSNDAGSVPW